MKASISHTYIWWQMDYQDKQTFKRNLWWPSTSTQQVVSEPLSHGKCPFSLVLFKIKSFTRKPYQKVCLPLHLLIKLSTKWTYLDSTIFKHYFTNEDWLNTREEGFFSFLKKKGTYWLNMNISSRRNHNVLLCLSGLIDSQNSVLYNKITDWKCT